MIWQILRFVRNSALARWIAGTALAGLVVKLLMLMSKREGVQTERAREAQRETEALQRGAKGAAEGKAKLRDGKTPQQIKDGNDAKWD